MADIKHNVVIKTTPDVVYQAVTTQAGIAGWWCKNTIAKPELGFTNVFDFGNIHNEMKVTKLEAGKATQWEVTDSIEDWMGTTVSFDLEDKGGKTLLRFSHSGYKQTNDTYAECSYHWALFMQSLKSYCETGAGNPS